MVFPASCVGCHTEIEQVAFDDTEIPPNTEIPDLDFYTCFMQWQASHWCDECWPRLSGRGKSSCLKCGARHDRPNPFADLCALCRDADLRFDRAIAIGNYQNLLQELVVRMKNQHDEALAFQLGVRLGYELKFHGWTEFDHLVPVPAWWLRKLKRGFLAADVLADGISETIGIPKSTQILHSTRPTRKQGTLSTQGRLANVRHAFRLNPRANIAGQRILLVDDVMTSGATSSELARTLKQHGAAEVSVAVVARGARVS